MSFIRAVFILSFMLTCAAASVAQVTGQCTLKTEQLAGAQELYGLHPGMTVEQVKARVPTLEMGQTDAAGLSKTSFSPEFHPAMDKAAYRGARTISLEFFDGRLSSLRVGYNASFKWKSLEEFVPGMSRALGLPNSWQPRSRGGQQLVCGDYQVTATMIGGSPSISISDEKARSTWEARQAAIEEAEESASHPEP
jgi:hypothetical protein